MKLYYEFIGSKNQHKKKKMLNSKKKIILKTTTNELLQNLAGKLHKKFTKQTLSIENDNEYVSTFIQSII